MTMTDPDPTIEPWSFDGGPTLPSHTLTPAERKRTGHLYKGCPNPVEQKSDRKGDGAVPCEACLLVEKAVRHEVELWRAIQEEKTRSWRESTPQKPTLSVVRDDSPGEAEIPSPPPLPAAPADMATDKQVAYLLKLAMQKRPEWVNTIGAEAVAERARKLTRKQASERLTALEQEADAHQSKQIGKPVEKVKAGHYAIPTTDGAVNSLAFYRVDIPTAGKWKGYTFVKRVIGGQPDANVPRAQAPGILARIAADPDAGPRYGWEIGRCCMCNRTLTNDESRAYGIGPECRTKGM